MANPSPPGSPDASSSLESLPSAEDLDAVRRGSGASASIRRFDMLARLAYGQAAGLQRQMRFGIAYKYTEIAREAWGEYKSEACELRPDDLSLN